MHPESLRRALRAALSVAALPAWVRGGITLLTLTGVWIAGLALRPPPVSDFHAHWVSAADLTLYLKGGVAILVYAPLARLGLPSSVAACLVNSLAWILLSRSFGLNRDAPLSAQVSATLVLLSLGGWWASMGALVNTDLPHLGLTLFGLTYFLNRLEDASPWTLAPAALLIGAGASVRLQILPGLLVMLALCGATWVQNRRRGTGSHRVARCFLVLAAAICVGGATDWALRMISAVPGSARKAITIRSPLYNGLLASALGPECGSWRPETNALISAEIEEDLWRVVSRRVGEHGWQHWARLMTCKARRLIAFRQLAWPDLAMSIPPRQGGKAADLPWILAASDTLGTCLSKLLLLALLAPRLGRSLARSNHLWLGACAVAIAYVALHLVLEIQPRYLLPVVTFPAWLAIGAFARPDWSATSFSDGLRPPEPAKLPAALG